MASPDLLERRLPGAHAPSPRKIPWSGWVQILKRAWKDSQDDQASLIAAGVAFYSFLSLFPAVIAGLLVYGLVLDPAEARAQAARWTENLPSDAASVVTKQMEQLSTTSHSSLGVGLVISLALALWSAAGGVGHLITAVNIAYDEEETRSFLRRRGLALLLTLGAVVFAVLTLALVAAAPAVLDGLVGNGSTRVGLEVARWVLLVVFMAVAVAVVYRVAPNRESPRCSWVSVGAVLATIGWIAASVLFSLYVDHFGSYTKTYGAVAGVVVLLLWLWMTVYLVLLGAEVNAEAEFQTVCDTTTGDPEPMGRGGAGKADTMPVGPDPG